MSYSPSPHSFEGGYSPSPFLHANTINIPSHLLRNSQSTNQSNHQYHGNTPVTINPFIGGSYGSLRSTTPIQIGTPVNQSINQRNTSIKKGLRYAGGYEIGPVMGVGTYGEVRQGRTIDGLNWPPSLDSDDFDQSINQSINQSLPPGTLVAIKLIDLNRFTEDTADLVRKEIRLLEAINEKINQSTNQTINQPPKPANIVRLIECIEDVAYTGEWCDSCACTQYIRSTNQSINQSSVCQTCGHPGSEHTKTETRPVLMLVQELLCGGELFGLLMHTGPLSEDLARFYFRQLIDGLQMLHEMNIVHRDLKPENLCLDANFDLKVIDFGLAAIEEPCLSLVAPHLRNQSTNQSTSQSYSPLTNSPSSRAVHQNPILKQPINSLINQSPSQSPNFSSSDPNNRSINQSTNQSTNQSLFLPHPLQYSGVGSLPYAPPEVYYVHSLYGHRGYSGSLADIWSSSIILFVMLLGRPPFMRPLNKTSGQSFRKCRHFISILNGDGFGSMSAGARNLIQKMLVHQSINRASFDMIRSDAWFNGPLIDSEERVKIMKERCETVWRKIDKPELADLMEQSQQQTQYFINQSINQSINQPINHSMNESGYQYQSNHSPRIQPFHSNHQSINQSNNQPNNQSINQSNNQHVNRSMNQSINQRSSAMPIPIPRSSNQSINQSNNQPNNQSVNQSIIRSINQPQLSGSFSLSSSMNESDNESSDDINRTVRKLQLE